MNEQLLEGDWLVIEIDGKQVDPEAPRAVRFEGDRVAGRVGVNRFTGSFTADGDVLEVGPVASTRMAGPPELMDLENRFNSHLQGRHAVALENDVLTLRQGDETVVMTRARGMPVQGTVTYRERIVLPPDSVVTVDLVDMSIADIAIEPIASQVIAGATGPPIPFALDSPEDVDEQRPLAVEARIVSAEGALLWATDIPAVVTGDGGPVELLLRRVG
ncbi:MAG TPA: META domain-containing protein [Acidimicrobiia bacterium]|jgi:heat shock protein HslJ|nr:META domain-containing protein [Acidimicrobiia bacterium]